jgi:hypothetical protein
VNKALRLLPLLLLLTLACSVGGVATPEAAPVPTLPPTAPAPSASPVPTIAPTDASTPQPQRHPCGDGVCESPETAVNCPADCADASATPTASAAQGSPCALPNPLRAVVSEELVDFQNVYQDSDFEAGSAEVVVKPAQHFPDIARVKRSQQAAHSGDWGYHIEAGPNQGALVTFPAYVEKGEDIRFSAWVRSPGGSTQVTPLLFWVEKSPNIGHPETGPTFDVGPAWQQIEFASSTTKGIQYALLAFDIGPDTTLDIDDVQVALPFWRMADYGAEARVVGGVSVPSTPAAVTHINFVIHIEDPDALHVLPYFQSQSAIFTELARIFYAHGGFLTIQPEQDWPQAAEEGLHPGMLLELAQLYDVQYSNHTHGPNCLDPEGTPRSAADCSGHPDWSRRFTNDDVVTYARDMRLLLEDASGASVTDHNGNFDMVHTSRLAEAGIHTLSVFKDRTTQRTYDRLYNNPWRPGQADALTDLEGFLTHDPAVEVVYIPGWGQALTRHPDCAAARIRPMLSQFIRFADPERVNTFYVVLHVSHFYSRVDDPNYLRWDEASMKMVYSEEFLTHLQYWDDVLTEVIDPLVDEGYLQWTSFADIGLLYEAWEDSCAQ